MDDMLVGKTTRMQPPAGLCSAPGITWVARIGQMTYGEWSAARSFPMLGSPSRREFLGLGLKTHALDLA